MKRSILNVKTDSMSYSYSEAKKRIKTLVRKITVCKMIADSIRDFIIPGFKIEVNTQVTIVPYNSAFPPKMDLWDKQVEILSRFFSKEPYKDINKDSATASFSVDVTKFGVKRCRYYSYSELFSHIYVDVTTANTEKCEIYQTDVVNTYKENVLTGYCKVLSERKYLEPAM